MLGSELAQFDSITSCQNPLPTVTGFAYKSCQRGGVKIDIILYNEYIIQKTIQLRRMALELNQVKQDLQQHLSQGLVVVVGSGLSCAEGMPGMPALTQHLAAADPVASGVGCDEATWKKLIGEIHQHGVEEALHRNTPDAVVADFIRTECATCMRGPEEAIIQDVLAQKRVLRFTSLLPFLPSGSRLPVVTTNYDRLLELAIEVAGYRVDTKALGAYHASFSTTDGAYAFCSKVEVGRGQRRAIRKVEHKVVSLYKPHGSLDWINFGGVPIRTGFNVAPKDALIITPGQQKYRAGYDKPFDMQRNLANDAINKASKLLIIGYGFNDSHLEVHLDTKIKSGTPTLILARSLTEKTRFHLTRASVKALERDSSTEKGTIVHFGSQSLALPNEELWDINGFVKGVMGK